MSVNIEAKFRSDPASNARVLDVLNSLAPEGFSWTRHQTDTFFDVPDGYLKLREEQDASAFLIAYRRPVDLSHGPSRPSDYVLVNCVDPQAMKAALAHVLTRGLTVEKTRTLWLLHHTRVHIDHITGLGHFVELETVVTPDLTARQADEECRHVIDTLGLSALEAVGVPYMELLRAHHTRTTVASSSS